MYKDFRPWTEEDKKEAEEYEKILRATGCPDDLIEDVVDYHIFSLYEEQFEDDKISDNFENENDNNSTNIENIKPEIDYSKLKKIDYSGFYILQENRARREAKAALRYYRRQKDEMLSKMTFEERVAYRIKIANESLEFAKELGMNIIDEDEEEE